MNKKIKAIIIDDESHCITTLFHLLNKECAEVEIIDTIKDSTTAFNKIQELKPDIIFLDIEMPILNGFDLLAQFSDIDFKVIFTTAYDSYAIKALKLNALDYLLKPIDKQEIRNAIDKYINNEIYSSKNQITKAQAYTSNKIAETIAITTTEGLLFIKMSDIIFLEGSSNYSVVHLQDGSKFLVSKTLSVFEEILTQDIFFRAHKSYIINLKFIKKYIRGEGGDIVMSNDTTVSLSRNKKQEFLDMFSKI